MTCAKCDKEAWLVSPMPGYYRYKCTCGWDSGFVHLDQRTTRDHEYYAMKMYKYTEREKEYEKSTECVQVGVYNVGLDIISVILYIV